MNNNNEFAPQSDFLKLLPDLWHGRMLILKTVIIATVAAGIISFIIPKGFDSEASLLLMPPPFKEAKDEMTSLIPKVLSVPDYEIMLQGDGVLMQAVHKVMEEAKGEKKGIWDEDDLESLKELSSLRSRMTVITEITEKNVTSMKYSPVIRLKARAGTPEQAQHLAEAWAEVSKELAVTVYKQGKTGLTDFMRSSFEDTRTMLTDLNRQIRDVEIEWNDELEQARLAKTHTRYLDYQEKIIDTNVKLAALREELASLEGDFANEQEKLELWRSPPMAAVFIGAELDKKPAKEPAPGADSNRQNGYEEEVLNPIYMELKQKIKSKRSELRSLEEYNRQMTIATDDLETELQDLRRECAVRTFERKQLDIQVSPLNSAYDTLSVKLQQAKIAETEQSNLADIKIVSEAALPDRKAFPPRTLIVLGAAVLSLMGACAYVITGGLLQRAGVKFT